MDWEEKIAKIVSKNLKNARVLMTIGGKYKYSRFYVYRYVKMGKLERVGLRACWVKDLDAGEWLKYLLEPLGEKVDFYVAIPVKIDELTGEPIEELMKASPSSPLPNKEHQDQAPSEIPSLATLLSGKPDPYSQKKQQERSHTSQKMKDKS